MKKILTILEVIAAQTMAETRGTSVNLSFANTPSDFDEMLFGIHVIEIVFTRSPGFRVFRPKNLQILTQTCVNAQEICRYCHRLDSAL